MGGRVPPKGGQNRKTKHYDFDTAGNHKCRPLVQNRNENWMDNALALSIQFEWRFPLVRAGALGRAPPNQFRMSVSPSVRLFKHFGFWSPNGWSDLDGRDTIRCAKAPERRWCRSRVGTWHVARATGRRVNPCKNFWSGLQAKRIVQFSSNFQVARTLV